MALKAIEDGRISGYPEYTSTALGSFFGVPSSQIPSNASRAYRMAAAYFARDGWWLFRRHRSLTPTRSVL